MFTISKNLYQFNHNLIMRFFFSRGKPDRVTLLNNMLCKWVDGTGGLTKYNVEI